MKKLAAVLVLALAVPGLALAAKPPAPGNASAAHVKAKAAHAKIPQVMYVLRGTLTAYTAADATNGGSVSILVASANRHGASLKTQTLTFALSSTTKIVTPKGAPLTVNDKGIVKLRGPKKVAATDSLAAALQAITAFQVVDQGPPS